MKSMESAALAAVPFLVGGLVASLAGFAVTASEAPFGLVTVHLAVVVAFGFALAVRVAPNATESWFLDQDRDIRTRLTYSGIVAVIIVTGVVGLVTLASSATLQLQPSLQFLQLLSALDIAWVVAALVIGGIRGWSRAVGMTMGVLVGAVCIWSIWNYLRIVGFTPDGGWLLDGSQLMRLVLPLDMVAAGLAIAVFVVGTRRAALTASMPQPIEQLSAQS
ncbi:MAG: hypothetical protein HKN07_04090 [Acidimicrobiia bacterium]|nr:hypothetical protein [Acidimicrobiia bacterium]